MIFQFALALLAATDCSPISASVDVDARGRWKHKVSQRSKRVVFYFGVGWLVGKRWLVRKRQRLVPDVDGEKGT